MFVEIHWNWSDLHANCGWRGHCNENPSLDRSLHLIAPFLPTIQLTPSCRFSKSLKSPRLIQTHWVQISDFTLLFSSNSNIPSYFVVICMRICNKNLLFLSSIKVALKPVWLRKAYSPHSFRQIVREAKTLLELVWTEKWKRERDFMAPGPQRFDLFP